MLRRIAFGLFLGFGISSLALGAATQPPTLPQIPADTVLGNAGNSPATAAPLSEDQLTGLCKLFTTTVSGCVPPSGGNTSYFLRGDRTWAAVPTGGSGGAPGGSTGQVQVNNSGAFGGITINGDATLNGSTGALTVGKLGGLSIATSATTDTTNATNISSGTLPAARLPAPTATTLGGVESAAPVTHQFVTGVTTAGVHTLAQPAASDISGLAASATTDTTNAANLTSGTLPAARLPLPTATTIGGVESLASSSHLFLNGISTAGVPLTGQPAFGDLTGAATLTQLPSIATNTVLGNVSGSTGSPSTLTFTQLTALLNPFSSTLSGTVPASGGGTTNYLRADGTWATPGGGGGGAGTVSSGTPGQIATYSANGTTVSGESVVSVLQGGLGNSVGNGYGLWGIPNASAKAVQVFGDSVAAGTASSSLATSYAGQLASDYGLTLTDSGIGGTMMCDISFTQVAASTNGLPSAARNPLYVLEGAINDANIIGVSSTFENNVTSACRRAAIAWLGIPSTAKTYAQASGVTLTGTWAPDTTLAPGVGEVSTTNGSTMSLPITTGGAPIYLFFKLNDTYTGTFSWSIDGGSATSVATHSTPAMSTFSTTATGINYVRIPAAAGSHTVLVTVTSATGTNNVVSILGVGSPTTLPQWLPPAVYVVGVIRQQADANAASTAAYDADARADALALFNDGVNAHFVDVRPYMTLSTDWANSLHPNDLGHRHMADAIEAMIQGAPIPLPFTGALPAGDALTQTPSVASNTNQYLNLNGGQVFSTTSLSAGLLFYNSGGNGGGMDMGFNALTGHFSANLFGLGGFDSGLSICAQPHVSQSDCEYELYVNSADKTTHVNKAVYQGLNGLLGSPTLPTVSSGFGTSPQNPQNTDSNGTWAFQIKVGSGGTASSGVVSMPPSAHGWKCDVTDETTTNATVFMTKQTADTTTSVTVGNYNTSGAAAAWVAGDTLVFSCLGR